MSIMRSLLRFIDPIEHRRQTAEERRKREVIPPEVDPDLLDEPPPPRTAPAPKPRTCRVCGRTGFGRYCPDCLAETMEPG